MKKLVLVAATTMLSVSAFADVTATAVATWDASATKDTTSALVVTPLKSLDFKYAEGRGAFNQVTGAFDVAIQGQAGATDFSLTSRVISNKLSRTSDNSTLNVGVSWNGEKLSAATPVELASVSKSITGTLSNLINGYNTAGRATSQGTFVFTVDSAAVGTAAPTNNFAALADGVWDGQVAVQFTATWTKPATPPAGG